MRFKSYLQEQEYRKPFTTASNMEEVIAWIKQHASNSIRGILEDGENNRIYRGMRGAFDDFSIGDSTLFRRKSANSTNQVQLMVASSKAWKDFPSRESAYICSTALSGADLHAVRSDRADESEGSLYFVIPADDARIGICPSYDFWDGFHRVGFKGTGFFDVDDLNRFIARLDTVAAPMSEDDPAKLRSSLRAFDAEWLMEFVNMATSRRIDYTTARKLVQSMERFDVKDLEQWIDRALDPTANGFTQTTGANYNGVDNRREVWINGKAAFIRIPGHSDHQIIEMLRKELA